MPKLPYAIIDDQLNALSKKRRGLVRMKYRVRSNQALGAGDFHVVTLVPVTQPPVPENQEVWRLHLPNGQWFLTEITPEAAAELQTNREFWVDLTPADA